MATKIKINSNPSISTSLSSHRINSSINKSTIGASVNDSTIDSNLYIVPVLADDVTENLTDLDNRVTQNTSDILQLSESVQQYTITTPTPISSLTYADIRSNVTTKVYWNGVILTKGVHYTLDAQTRTITLTDGETFNQWDEIIIVTEGLETVTNTNI